MKISYCSDLHIEAGEIVLSNNDNADVLVLAGDIFVSNKLESYSEDCKSYHSQKIHNFFVDCSSKFDHIIFVAGNHEHYNSNFCNTLFYIKSNLSYIKNLHILEDSLVDINGVLFVGNTMWTNMNNDDLATKDLASKRMNDFRFIKNANRKFTPDDSVYEFNRTTQYLDLITQLHPERKIVVVTHHSPSFKSIDPVFGNEITNYGFHSDCEYLMKENVVAWLFGHTHSRHAYYINNTFVSNNARGYTRFEDCASTFQLKTIDLDCMPSRKELKSDQYWLFHPEEIQ